MRNLYTLSLLFLAAAVSGQNVVFTTIVDGTLGPDGCTSTTGTSSPKIAEMYVSGTVDFTNYRFQIESNGASDPSVISWSSGLDLSPLGTVTNSFVYLVGLGTATFNEMYPSITLPGFSAASVNGNGNDAYRIAITDGAATPTVLSVVDQFGNPLDIPTTSDYSAVWAYQDSYAKRVNGVGPNGGNFNNASFTYGGIGAFVDPNNNCAFISSAINLGSFILGTPEFAIQGLKIFPNPVVDGNLFITSNSNAIKDIVIYSIMGKQVFEKSVTSQSVDISHLNNGFYIIKITQNGAEATSKLIIR